MWQAEHSKGDNACIPINLGTLEVAKNYDNGLLIQHEGEDVLNKINGEDVGFDEDSKTHPIKDGATIDVRRQMKMGHE